MSHNIIRSTDPKFMEETPGDCAPAIAIVRDAGEDPPSAIALRLFDMLEREGIGHCHWKSNIRLAGTLRGTEDIDLLVDPLDAGALQRIIHDCGFKLAVSRMGVGHPGVFHAVAWDADLGRLLDLHVYHQLISGDSLVKSYRFPVERELIARSVAGTGARITDPAAELLLYLLRILLKHSSLIEIRKVNSHFATCREELDWLIHRCDVGEAEALCREWFPSLGIPIREMVECVATGSLGARVMTGLRVARAMRHHRRIGHVAAACSRLLRFGDKYANRLRSRRSLSLLAGGAWIALVGPKGTGKSTLAKLVARRLGSKLDVQRIHFGKPPRTWRTFLPAIVVAAARKVLRHASRGPARSDTQSHSTLFVISKLLVADDRRRLLARALRAVASGTILISDRCHVTNGTGMDGSAFDDRAVACARSPLQRWLMEQERAIYRSLPRPRLVIQLSVPLETALQRDRDRRKRGGPDPAAVQRRWSREKGSEFAGSTLCRVDTAGTLEDSMKEVAAQVWQAL